MVKGMNKFVLAGVALVLLVGLAVGGWHWQQQREIAQAYETGMAAADAKKYEEALAIAQPYADRNDPQIDHLLGMIYINGPDGIKDIDRGLTYRRAAAGAGNMQAAYYLGKWLIEEEATEKSISDGMAYLRKAADCGMPNANSYLGSILLDGKLVDRDIARGRDYSLFAALAGMDVSQYNMSYSYALGHKLINGFTNLANTDSFVLRRMCHDPSPLRAYRFRMDDYRTTFAEQAAWGASRR